VSDVVRDQERLRPMALLQQGVPLSLLLDLVLGPRSEELLVEEHRGSAPLATALPR
jgi:hypothetical protein